MSQIQAQTKQTNAIKSPAKQGTHPTINRLNYSKNILSNVTKDDQLIDQTVNSPVSTPYRNYQQSTLRSEQLISPEQTTLNLSNYHNQNGVLSGTFYGGMNSSLHNSSKYNLDPVRNEYFQNSAQNQSSSQQHFYSPKINVNQQDSCASISTRKSNIVPPLRLNKISSNQINQMESVESFELGSSTGRVQLPQNLKSNKKDPSSLSFLYLSTMDRTASTQKTRFENNNHNQIHINGFFTERPQTNNCSSGYDRAPQSRGILKVRESNHRQLSKSKSKERGDGIQVIQSQLINTSEFKLQKPKSKNESQRASLKKSENIHEESQEQSTLEFQCLTERRFSQRPYMFRTVDQLQDRKKSQENVINANGYFSPIGSVNHLNQTQYNPYQQYASFSNQKSNQGIKFNDSSLPQDESEEQSQRQISSLNSIPTISQQILKRKINQQKQQNQTQQQSAQIQIQQQQQLQQFQQQNSLNKKYQSTLSSQQKSPILQSSNSNREILNLKKNDSKLIQFLKSPRHHCITNSIIQEENQPFSLDSKENKSDEGLVLKFKTESDLYQQAITPKVQNLVSNIIPLKAQQSNIQNNNSNTINNNLVNENKNQYQQLIKLTSQSVPNIQINSGKKVLKNIVQTVQKQTQKLNVLQEFMQKQSQAQVNKKLSGIGLNIKKQGDLLEFWKEIKEKTYAKNNVELVFKKNKFDQLCLGAYMEIIEKINQFCVKEINNPGIYNQHIEYLQKLINLLQPHSVIASFFLIRLYVIQGKFSYKCGNIYNALKSFFAAKHLASSCKDFQFKMKLHKYLGQCFKLLKDFRKAKSQFIKMLTLSWVLNDKDSELQSYDELGIIFYYECEIPLAQRLHQRLCLDITEDDHSKARQSAVENFKQRIKYSDQQKNMEFSTTGGDIKDQYKKSSRNSIKELPNDIEELHISDSSDEEPDYYLREIVQKDIQKQELQEQERMDIEKSQNSQKNIKLRYSKLSQDREITKEQELIYQRILDSQQFSENTESERKKKNPAILISHLSRNRSSNNYKETSVKEYQYFHLKKFQQQLQPGMNQQQFEMAASRLNQFTNFKNNSISRPYDEQTPASLVNLNNTESLAQIDEENPNHSLFRFVVSNSALKCLTQSLEKIKKQFLLLLHNIEKYESSLKNQNQPMKRNAFIFH